jgi:prevent-host-death family protein
MPRYKRFGDMLEAELADETVEEVSVRELSRNASAVLARVQAGSRVVVTKHGTPVAVLLEIEEAVGLCGMVLLSRRDAERRLFGDELASVFRHRELRRGPRLLGGD